MSESNLIKAVQVMEILLANGKWEQQQTHESLIPYLMEEVQEFKEAVARGDTEEIKNELADILLQVLFHAGIAAKNGGFDIELVAQSFINKIETRSPEILEGKQISIAEQKKLWEERKL